MRDIAEFLRWTVQGDHSAAPVTIVQTVTGVDLIDTPAAPGDAAEFAECVVLVEQFDLRNLLSLVAPLSPTWWRVVGNWDRLVAALDEDEPRWREGVETDAAIADDMVATLIDTPLSPGRLLLDMDGPLAAFDPHALERCASEGWGLDIATTDAQTHRYFTEHIPDETHRDLARAMVDRPGWYRGLPVTEGADRVRTLVEHEWDVWVVTKPHSSNPTCCDEKLAWLREHFPYLADRCVLTPSKSLVGGTLLLDDAIVHDQVPVSNWMPVAFAVPFNQAGSAWGRYPRWSWGDPVERLAWSYRLR